MLTNESAQVVFRMVCATLKIPILMFMGNNTR